MLPSHHAYTDDDEDHRDKDEGNESLILKKQRCNLRQKTDHSATTNHNIMNAIVRAITFTVRIKLNLLHEA